MVMICQQCKKENSIADRVAYRETCLHCSADLHSCVQCEFYDPRAYNECRETSAERILEKSKSNFCDFYAPAKGAGSGPKAPAKDDLKAAAEALFKKK